MNKRRNERTVFCLLLTAVLCIFCLCSCATWLLPRGTDATTEAATTGAPLATGTVEGSDTGSVQTTAAAADTSAEVNENNGNVTDAPENELEIIPPVTVDGELSPESAAALGIRSAVSVYCSFETTSGGGSFWNPTPTTQTYYSVGSGVIYRLYSDGSAFIITNYHVVYDGSSNTENKISDKIYLYLYGMESEEYAVSASYVGGSANYDIAVLRVDGSDVLRDAAERGCALAAAIGDSDAIYPGQSTIAVGNPAASDLGGISVTKGIVSVESEYITMTAPDGTADVSYRVIRTDAPVNSGNSGGGLYNLSGELIGIVNAKISSSSVESIGYAIPVGVVRAVADNIIDNCYKKECESVMRAILGVTVTSDELYTVYDEETGLISKCEVVSVYGVNDGSPCSQLLLVNDVIKSVTVDGKTVSVTRRHHLIDAVLDARVGDTVSFTLIRDGAEVTVSITVEKSMMTKY